MLRPLCYEMVKQTLERTRGLFFPFSWVRSARILINNGRRREVGNTGGTHSEDPGFKPTSSRQLFRMSFFVVSLRLTLHRHKKHNYKARILVLQIFMFC